MMKWMSKTFSLLCCCFLPIAVLAKGSFDFVEPEFFVDKEFVANPQDAPMRVAVLPAINQSDEPSAAQTVRLLVYNHFSALGYRDVELALVDRRLQSLPQLDYFNLSQQQRAQLRNTLKVDGVILTKIRGYETTFALFASEVRVKLEIEFLDLRNGKRLWWGKLTGRSIDGGIPLDVLSAIGAIFSSSMNTDEAIVYRVANEVVYDLLSKLPDLPASMALNSPRIRFLEHNGSQKPMRAGDWFQVLAKSEPELVGYLSVAGWLEKRPLEEIEPGLYSAKVQIPDNINLGKASVQIELQDSAGNHSQWTDYSGGLSIDNIPPPVPVLDQAVGQSGSALLSWSIQDESDVASYQILRSEQPLTDYQQVNQQQKRSYQDVGLKNNHDYYYKVVAVDAAGNQSKESNRQRVHPVAKGPTKINNISYIRSQTWYAAASPYIIEGTLQVDAGVSLTIEAGTRVLFAPDAKIKINGELRILGSAKQPVLMKPHKQESWNGVLINRSYADNLIQNLTLEGSKHGLFIADSQVVIQDSRFRQNSVGLRVQNSDGVLIKRSHFAANNVGLLVKQANPLIQECRFQHNKFIGLQLEAAQAKLERNSWVNNGVFHIFNNNSSNLQLDINQQYWATGNPLAIMAKLWGRFQLEQYLDSQGRSHNVMDKLFDDKQITTPPDATLTTSQLYRRGLAAFSKQEYPLALALLNRYTLQQLDAEVLFAVGRIYFARRDFQKAKLIFEQLIQLQPEHSQAYWYAANSQWQLNQPQQAQKLLEKGIARIKQPSETLMVTYQKLQ